MKNDTQYLKAVLIKGADGAIEFVASDESVDRSGEVIPASSWDLSNFLKSPRLLVDHDYRVESIVGVAENTRVEGKELRFMPKFHEITELAKTVKQMVEQGVLDTVSVGFLRKTNEKDVTQNELMEISFVAVPANPNARMLAVKSIDAEATKAVEEFLQDSVPAEEVPKKAAEEETPPTEPAPVEEPIEPTEPKDDAVTAAMMKLHDACLTALSPDTTLEEMKAAIQAAFEIAMQEIAAALENEEPEPPVQQDEKGIEIKAGRVLSEKNRGIIQTSIDSMQSSIAALGALLTATQAQGDEGKGHDGGSPKPKRSNTPQPALDSLKTLEAFRERNTLERVVRIINTATSEALAKANSRRAK